MRRATAVLAVLVAAVLVPARPAAAKELTTLSVCGAHGCVSRTDRLGGADRGHAGLLDTGMPVADPGAAPFVRLKLGIGDGRGRVFGRDVMIFQPRSGLVRAGDGVWYELPPRNLSFFRKVAAGVSRLPASRLPPPRPPSEAPPPPTPAAPAAQATAAPAPAARSDGGGGAPASLLAGGSVLLLAAGACGTIAWRRRRRHGAEGRPAAG